MYWAAAMLARPFGRSRIATATTRKLRTGFPMPSAAAVPVIGASVSSWPQPRLSDEEVKQLVERVAIARARDNHRPVSLVDTVPHAREGGEPLVWRRSKAP